MKTVFHKLMAPFAESPFVLLSLLTCCWLYFRTLLYDKGVSSLLLDLPLFTDSRLANEMNLAVTLTLFAFIGIGAGIAALYRDKEQAWYICLVMIGLNCTIWCYALSQLNWAPLYES